MDLIGVYTYVVDTVADVTAHPLPNIGLKLAIF